MKTIKGALLAAASSVMLATALAAPGQAIPFRDDVGDQGAQDFAQGWDGVVQIFMWNRVTGSIGFNCTGSMINARTVISAAHCFDDFPESVYANGPGSLTPIVAYGPDTFVPLFNWLDNDIQFTDDLNGLTFGVDLLMHPSGPVGGATDFPAADVAMIALQNPLYTLPTYGMLFSPIPEDVFNEGVLVNQIGYGTFHPGSDSSASSINGRRRAGENMLGLMASQNDFFQALARNEAGGFPSAGNNQLLYWTDFDLPGRTGTCERTNLGPTAEDSIFCDDNAFGDGVRLDGDTVVLPGPSIDYFPGDALDNEVATAGGDSGGPLMAMNLFNNPLILGVLSGGFNEGFFHGSGQSYGEVSYYNPLFTYHQWISENNPYKYVSAVAGDGNWSDAAHWVQGLDPNYFVYNADGEIVNGLPDGDEEGLDQRRPTAGTVFDTPVGDFDTQDDPVAAPAGVTPVAAAGRDFAANGLVATGVVADTSASGIVATNTAYEPELVEATTAEAAEATTQTVSGVAQTLTGPGFTGFVPNNFYGTPNAAAFVDPAQFFDVTLAAAGTTIMDLDSVEIDNLTIANAGATLEIAEDNFLASLIGVNIMAGELVVNGDLFSRELMLWNGVLSGSGSISLFDPNSFLGNGEILNGALFNVSGVVTAGAVGETGVLSVNGDYVQSSGGILGVDWNATDADLLDVLGDVSLNGVVGVNAIDGYVPTFGDTRRIIEFGGDLVGGFTGDNLAGVLYLEYTYGDGFVDATIAAESFSTQTTFQNTSQSNLAGYLDAVRDTSYAPLRTIYGSVDRLEGDTLTAAMESLLPHEAFQMRRATESHLDVFNTQMRNVVLGEASGTGPVGEGAAFTASLMDTDHQAGLQDASLAILAEDAASGPNLREMARGVRIFAAAGQIDGDLQTTASTSSDLDGDYGMVGVDFQTQDWLRLGVTLAYASTEAEARPGLSSTVVSETDTFQIGGYALAERGNLIGLARVAAASHDNDVRRAVTAGSTNFDSTGQQDADSLEVSALLAYRYDIAESNAYVTPVVSLTWSETEYDASEQASGSVGSISVAESISGELVGRLGLNVGTQFKLGEAVIEPRAYIGLADNLRDFSETVYASFNGATGAFAVDAGLTENDEWQEMNIGVLVHLPNDLSLALSYESVEDRGNVLDTETLSVGARFRF